MKTILFIASEPNHLSSPDCNNLYKKLDKKLQISGRSGEFIIKTWFQPDGRELIEQLETSPNYLHYCGHGNDTGNLVVENRDGNTHVFNQETLKKYLNSNPNLNFLFFGSCNSSELVNDLKKTANYSIGFKGTVKSFEIEFFAEQFYEELFRHGSILHAYLNTFDKIKESKSSRLQPIFRSNLNYIMEAILIKNQELRSAKEQYEAYRSEIEYCENQREQLSEDTRTIFDQLLLENPFAREIFIFKEGKEKIAREITKTVLLNKDKDYLEKFQNRFQWFLDIFADILVAFDNGKYSKKSIKLVTKNVDKEDFKRALLLLKNVNLGNQTNREFSYLFENRIDFILQSFF
jgi:hypothetical protein